jgi:TBC1 domain family protein 5
LKTLGDAVGWAVDVLLLDEEVAQETKEGQKTLRQKKTEAVECMAYVRDVLSRGGKGEVDEERLVSEEEYRGRRQRKEETERADAAPVHTEPPPPKPVLPPPRIASSEGTSDSMAKPRTMLSTRDSTRPISSLTRTPVAPNQTPLTSSPNTLNIPLASRGNPVPRSRPKPPATTAAEPKKVSPPWQHTRSNFSDNSPFASGSLPRLPPPSTTAPPRKPPDHSLSRSSPPNTNDTAHEPPRADPLGVLR